MRSLISSFVIYETPRVVPLSTKISAPVIEEAKSETKNKASEAISSGSTIVPKIRGALSFSLAVYYFIPPSAGAIVNAVFLKMT